MEQCSSARTTPTGAAGWPLIALGMGRHLSPGTLNQAALARDRAGRGGRAGWPWPRPFVVWMLVPVVDDVLLRAEVGYAGGGRWPAARCCGPLERRGAAGPPPAARGRLRTRCSRGSGGRWTGRRSTPPPSGSPRHGPVLSRRCRRRARRRSGGRGLLAAPSWPRPGASRGPCPRSTSTTSPWPRRASATSASTAPSPGPPSTPPRRSSPRPTAGSAPTATTSTIAPRSWARWASPTRRAWRPRSRPGPPRTSRRRSWPRAAAPPRSGRAGLGGTPSGTPAGGRAAPRSGSSPARTAAACGPPDPPPPGALPCAGLRVLTHARHRRAGRHADAGRAGRRRPARRAAGAPGAPAARARRRAGQAPGDRRPGRPDGAAWLERGLARADVVVDGFRPGALARLGLHPAPWPSATRDVVHVSLSAWGEDGPGGTRAASTRSSRPRAGVAGRCARPTAREPPGALPVGGPRPRHAATSWRPRPCAP